MVASCDLIIPCKDEELALAALLGRVPGWLSVIVVDNGSCDDTPAVATRLGATLVSEPRSGYGAAVHAGVMASTADLVAVIDGDGTLDPLDLLPMIEAVSSRRCTLAVGRRDPTKRGLMPFTARLGNRLVTGWLRRQGLAIPDIAPARVCRRLDLLGLKVLDRRFGYPVELLRRAGAAGWDICEFEVSYSARALGTRSKVSGTVRGTVLAAVDFVRLLA